MAESIKASIYLGSDFSYPVSGSATEHIAEGD